MTMADGILTLYPNHCLVCQWYTIAMEDFSVLDTLVWMGVQMHKLFQDTY